MRREKKEEEAGLTDFYFLCIAELSVVSVSQVCVMSSQYCESTIQLSPFLFLLTSQRLFSQLFLADSNAKSNSSTILPSLLFCGQYRWITET